MTDTHPLTCDIAETFMIPGHQQETAAMVALSARERLDRNTDNVSMIFNTQCLKKDTLQLLISFIGSGWKLGLCSFIHSYDT